VAEGEQAMRAALAFLQHYRESAEYLERTYAYVERVDIRAVRDAVLGEAQEELLERFWIAKAAVADPWLERHSPVVDGELHLGIAAADT
jgi:nitrite reductase (NADH) large subunit